jgi:hypothetical protein
VSLKIHVSKVIVVLLGLNFFTQLIWLFGFHNKRLILLAVTGTSLLGLFFYYDKSVTGTQFKGLILLSVIFGLINSETGFIVRAIIDLCAFGIISSVFLIQRIDRKELKTLFYLIVLSSIVYFTYTITLMDFTLIGADVDRREAFRQFGSETLSEGGESIGYIIYVTQQSIIAVFSLALLLLPLYYDNKKVKIQWVIFGLILLFNAIYIATYQKRQPLLELAVLFLIYGIYYSKLLPGLIPKSRVVTIMLIFGLLIFGLSLNVFNTTIERFNDSFNNINSFDRLIELEYALTRFSALDFVFGMGLGSKIEGTLGGNNLHIGYGTLLMKGGLLLLVFYFTQTISNIIYCYRKAKLYPIFNVGIAISIFSLIQLSIAPGWGWYITTLVTGLAMFSRYLINSIVKDKYYYSGIKR